MLLIANKNLNYQLLHQTNIFITFLFNQNHENFDNHSYFQLLRKGCYIYFLLKEFVCKYFCFKIHVSIYDK